MDLYTLKTKLKQTKGLRFIYYRIRERPHIYSCIQILCKYLKIDDFSNGKEVEKNRAFFAKNQDKIDKILNLLEDEKSKKIFARQIRYLTGETLYPVGNAKTQYFPKDIIHLSDNEVFVDCGAFTGDSIDKFLQACKGKYKKIVAFEPSEKIFLQLKQRNLARCHYFNCGVWDKTTTLSFCSDSNQDDALANTSVGVLVAQRKAQTQVEVQSIDSIPTCADMTFLKMDIEGAELPALKGAEHTIRRQHPLLAISIYHSNEELLEIPLWIAALGLPYTHHVRLHGHPYIDLVWYAVPKRAAR